MEKSASRAVMEKILQMGITLVLDMKLNRLERVARCTGSPILSCDNALNPKLRHCDSLYFEKFVEEHAIVGEGGKKPSKTLMFLEGCPTRLGCTVSPSFFCYSSVLFCIWLFVLSLVFRILLSLEFPEYELN